MAASVNAKRLNAKSVAAKSVTAKSVTTEPDTAKPAAKPAAKKRVRAKPATRDALATYRDKRQFDATPEPAGGTVQGAGALQPAGGSFVIQKHWATRLHYDFRLELDGVMKSWAVPKGPSLDPRDKRMAIATEDHPIEYNRFDGQIPAGHYGAGRVVIWDNGRWTPVGDAHEGLAKGDLKFELRGHKLRGRFVLVRTQPKDGAKKAAWLLIKERDAYVRSHDEFDVLEAMPDAVPALDADASTSASTSPASTSASTSRRASRKPIHGKPAVLPATIDPQLAQAVSGVPADADQRLWEIKLDGYRLLVRIDAAGKATLHTRNAQDWTARFPSLVAAFQALRLREAWVDGELVAMDARGLPSFEALQRAIADANTNALVYFAFDLLFVDGEDWRALPLHDRRARLEALVASPHDNIRMSQTFDAPPSHLAAASKAAGLEGLMGKRIDGPYRSGRSDQWVKLKHGHHEEFVIAGYTQGEGGRAGTFGALVLASHDVHGVLRHAGNVGSGFDETTLSTMAPQLRALRQKQPTLDDPAKDLKGTLWVRPELVAQISYAALSRDGRVKHAVFRGLREDKDAHEVERETTTMLATVATPLAVNITNPERVIDASTGHTKLDLVRHFERVAPLMLEHLRQRPVSWLRAPDGLAGETFFQKHLDRMTLAGVATPMGPGGPNEPLIEILDAKGLVGAAQMNVFEFHTWNARFDDLLHPDRMILDLDPGEGLPWPQVQEAAMLVRTLLQELGLPVFLKTSGGKGLHLVVPLERVHAWAVMHGFSQVLAQHLARVVPQRFTAIAGARNRVKKVYVDPMRNSRGATTVCAWSARARPGLGVSVPIGWDELSGLSSGAHWTLANVDRRLRIGNGPWRDYATSAVRLDDAMAHLGHTPLGHTPPGHTPP